MSELKMIIDNTIKNPYSRQIEAKAMLLARVQNEINITEVKRDDSYSEFQKQLLKPENRDTLQKAMLYCTEQCVALSTLIKCSRMIEETL